MFRRRFLGASCALAASFSLPVMASAVSNRIEESDVIFTWSHLDEILLCRFDAPTPGWLAVGFNSKEQLQGTRFIIATTSEEALRLEEHIAEVPAHRNVRDLGLPEVANAQAGRFENGRSLLTFSMPVKVPGQPELDLGDSAWAYLMLAWSHDTDFNHHSAWRKHYSIIL